MIKKYLLNGLSKKQTASNQKYSFVHLLMIFTIPAFVIISTGCQSSPPREPYIDRSAGYYSTNIIVPPEVDHWALAHPIEPSSNIPKEWYPPKSVEKDWEAIIIHHSATDTGNMAKFHKSHIEEHNWEGIGYDFVIGNGTDSGDGQVEVTYRWTEQKVGAHCKTPPDNWANIHGIGICLVGNFNNTRPTKAQMNSLVKLTDFLQRRYTISQSKITGHGDTPRAYVTDCPGNLFPMGAFKSSLSF